MNYEQIAISILLPTLISFIVTYFNNKRQKNLDFEYDYRKFILEKRKHAYNRIEPILNFIEAPKFTLKSVQALRDNKVAIDFKNTIEEYQALLQVRKELDIWLRPQIYIKLSHIYFCLTELKYAINTHNEDNLSHKLEHIILEHSELVEIYFQDIMELGRIENFRNNKIKSLKKTTQSRNAI